MSNAPEAESRREGRLPFRAVGLLVFLHLATRALSLNALPIFLDEAVHLQWAERLFGEGRILRPVGSGRLLAVAAYGVALPFEDRLGAARMVASLAGAATLVLTMLLSDRLFGTRASLIAGTLYLLSPFALVYDRLALSDGFLSACLTAMMLAAVGLVRAPNRGSARLRLAVLIALAILAKVSALLFLLTVPLAVPTLSPDRRSALRAAIVAVVLGLLLASPMLGFFAVHGGEIANQHLVDPGEAASTVARTLVDMGEWARSYFTLPALLAAAVSLFLLRDGRALWLGGTVALPFILFALFSQPWSARYVLPTLPPFLILIAGGVDRLASRLPPASGVISACVLAAMASISFLSFDRALLFDPSRAPFPSDDSRQLVTGWPAGYGVREIALRLSREAESGTVVAYVDGGGTRTLSTSLAVLLGRRPSIRLIEGDFESDSFRASMIQGASGSRVFAVLSPRASDFDFKSRLTGIALERLEAYARPGGEWAGTLFRLAGPAQTGPGSATEGRVF
jgi:hypothetical protein